MSDEDLEKSTQNSLHQRKHHTAREKKLRLTLKMEKRKVMIRELRVSTRVTKSVALFNS